jgi:peroxiredoxin
VQLESFRPALEALDVELIVLAAEDLDALRRLRDKQQLHARFLADPEAKELQRLGAAHLGGGPGGRDIALPMHWLIDRQGQVLDRYQTSDVRERRSAEQILVAVRRALGAGSSS